MSGKIGNVERWLKSVSGSESTKYRYPKLLSQFCNYYNVNPEEIINRWKEVKYKSWELREKFVDEWSEKIQDYYLYLEGYAPLSRKTMLSPILSLTSTK